jgi:hypothetical protein
VTPCPTCAYCRGQLERLQEETLRLRLDVADGPRTRVRELEIQLERANSTITDLNQRLRRRRT